MRSHSDPLLIFGGGKIPNAPSPLNLTKNLARANPLSRGSLEVDLALSLNKRLTNWPKPYEAKHV